MIPVIITKQLAAASANNIALSQSPGSATNMTLNGAAVSGGVATLDTQRQVLFTFAADETGKLFTVYGTNQSGSAISEVVAGKVGTAVTLQDYKTVTRIATSAATAGALTVGTNGVGSTGPQLVNYFQGVVSIGFGTQVDGTANYTIQYAYENDPCGMVTGTQPLLNWFDMTAQAAKSADTSSAWSDPITCWRMVINSGTDPVTVRAVQTGVTDSA